MNWDRLAAHMRLPAVIKSMANGG